MKKIFVCSPYRGDVEKNTKRAAQVARILCECGYMPVVPHLYFPNYLREEDQHERIRGIELGIELMKECDKIWLLGPEITSGMEYELEAAKELKIPVVMYDEELRQIKAKSLAIDDRLDNRVREILKGLKLD
ncbi:MAG: DUF4406 domain-containing protein [Clostridia bacterium]|nr:DUF4406 domain-containing protein [Clostridia bacterium]